MTQPIEINVEDVKSLLDQGIDFVLVDCREPGEIALVAIDGSMRIPMGELQQRLAELEPYRQERIVVHCHLGGRSLMAARYLRSQGFEQAQSMAGGIDVWAEQIDPSLARY